MNNSQATAEIIEKIAKDRGFSITTMLTELKMNKNALFTMKKSGYLPRAESLCKFADYLGCSVDYLLGRTDNPNGSYVNGDNSVQNVGNNSSVTITDTQKQDTLTDEFIEIFGRLSFTEKVKVMNFVADMVKNEVYF